MLRDFKIYFYVNSMRISCLVNERVGYFVTVYVVVRRGDWRGMTVKRNDDDEWSSDDMVLWLGRRQNGDVVEW
jgi:hypothetical protein